jgi:HAD superfamily phosphoserine phosphatase-like hydrolase
MNRRKAVEEVKGVNEVKEKSGGAAAFFDLDGTLVALPSLERRLLRTLRHQKEIPARNYFLWLKEAIRLMPRGINAILQGNKMYLRGVRVFDECGEGDGDVSTWHKSGHQAEGQATLAPPPRILRLPVPTFFSRAVERVSWHAKQGHQIVLLSGTLEPLACDAARRLEAELAARGSTAKVRVIATRLEEAGGRWTGRMMGEAMFGRTKARAAKRLVAELRLDLERCFAYGDSAQDRWLLSLVRNAMAVNPSHQLETIALREGWTMELWDGDKDLTRTTQRTLRTQRKPDSRRVARPLPLPEASSGAHG